jgi:hypothetical protein
MVSTKKMILPKTSLRTRIVHFYGDSYVVLFGNYPDRQISLYQQSGPYVGIGTGNPTADGKSSAGYAASTGGHYDACTFATFRRSMAKQNMFVGKIGMWAQSAAGFLVAGSDAVNKVQDRITTALRLERPDVAVFMSGYNDAIQNGNNGPSDLPAYRTLVQTSVNDVLAKNPNAIIIICTLPWWDVPTYYAATKQAALNVNAQYAAVAAATPQVTLLDTYTDLLPYQYVPLDGWVVSSTDAHPGEKTTVYYGKNISSIVMKRLLS